MDIFLTFNVSPDLLKKCQQITGTNVTVNTEGGGDIQIVATKYRITENTKLIQSIYASLDQLGLKNVPAGVTVCKNPGAFAQSMCEQIIGLLLTSVKKIIDLNTKTHHRIFRKEIVDTLRGKKLGIIGYGEIGKKLASIARGFEMEVIAYTRSQRDDPNVNQFVASIAKLMGLSDIVVILLPLTNKTRGIINADALAMFNGKIIVNTAKADIVNKTDMLWYLKRFPEKYYLADVWWGEPIMSEEPPANCILTPHVSDQVPGDFEDAVLKACENAKKFIEGNPQNVVDPGEYY
ncbi:MAG: glycerate dehydrogenase [Candidatus Thermoplasmatota archaeon]|nr:glycerate dehydrogenase [Candidatus Thermoplasmatota archaeon]